MINLLLGILCTFLGIVLGCQPSSVRIPLFTTQVLLFIGGFNVSVGLAILGLPL